MSVIALSKVSLIGLNFDREDILRELMELGVMHISDVGSYGSLDLEESKVHTEDNHREILVLEENIGKVEAILKHLDPYDHRGRKLIPSRRRISRENYEMILAEREQVWNIARDVEECERQMNHLKLERNKCSNLIEYLNPWTALDIPLEKAGTRFAGILTGYIPARTGMEKLKEQLEEECECYSKALSRDHEHMYICMIYHMESLGAVESVLKDFDFNRVVFRELEGTAEDNIRRAQMEIEELDGKYKECEKSMEKHAAGLEKLETLYDFLLMERDRKRSYKNLGRTGCTFMVEGWIPEEIAGSVTGYFHDRWDCAVQVRNPEPDEEYPVLLNNNRIGRTVEAVTGMYSLPSPRETDPNFITALFFILFYGLMMGDVIYGLIMIAASSFILSGYWLEEGMHRFIKLIQYCGFSTVFWGILFGGWFGIPAMSEYYLWINPIENPERFLYWTLLFGIIHIYAGLGVKGYNLFKQKKYLDIILDVAVWYVFFTGFVLFVLPLVFGDGTEMVGELAAWGTYMLVAGGIVIVCTQGRKQKNFFMKLLTGLTKLYDLIKFMSDVLSYSRLMALSLATSVIGYIVYDIGSMNGFDNPVKIIYFIFVMAIGHVLNFGIAVLSAYVHASRLQYIEFFGRFYKGGGIPFEPLKANTKFIYIEGGKYCE